MKILSLLLLLLLPMQAMADVEDRVGRIERTLELLQRKLLTQGASSPLPVSGAPTPTMTSSAPDASFEIRLSSIEEQLRDLRGLIEQIEYRQQRQEVEMQKLAEDMEFRFEQLRGDAPGLPPLEGEPITGDPALFEQATQAAQSANAQKEAQGFGSPRELYDDAFKLLGSGAYADASEKFAQFIRTYPKDNLIGNAYYWLGETFYVRSDYVRAAEQFRLGFEALPKGPKANDNLLKLAMSLAQIQKEKEACVVLKQLTKPSKSISDTIQRRAKAEFDRIACK